MDGCNQAVGGAYAWTLATLAGYVGTYLPLAAASLPDELMLNMFGIFKCDTCWPAPAHHVQASAPAALCLLSSTCHRIAKPVLYECDQRHPACLNSTTCPDGYSGEERQPQRNFCFLWKTCTTVLYFHITLKPGRILSGGPPMPSPLPSDTVGCVDSRRNLQAF